jgi:hypothetical protein
MYHLFTAKLYIQIMKQALRYTAMVYRIFQMCSFLFYVPCWPLFYLLQIQIYYSEAYDTTEVTLHRLRNDFSLYFINIHHIKNHIKQML